MWWMLKLNYLWFHHLKNFAVSFHLYPLYKLKVFVKIPFGSSGASNEMPMNTDIIPSINIVVLNVSNTCLRNSEAAYYMGLNSREGRERIELNIAISIKKPWAQVYTDPNIKIKGAEIWVQHQQSINNAREVWCSVEGRCLWITLSNEW